jgi:hypothetical protein
MEMRGNVRVATARNDYLQHVPFPTSLRYVDESEERRGMRFASSP